MTQILKRLELIKTSMEIEDDEIINLQISKLKTLQIDESIKDILLLLENHDYYQALELIEQYLSRFSGVVVYEDKELSSLKLELKVLENRLTELNEEKNEYLNQISDFHDKYNLVLGELIKNILQIRKDISHKKIINKTQILKAKKTTLGKIKEQLDELAQQLQNYTPFDREYDEIYKEFKQVQEDYVNLEKDLNKTEEEFKSDNDSKEYQEAKKEYEEFNEEYQELKNKNINELNEHELIELKKTYRKAVKLCHPDIVADDLKLRATQIIQELNDAYEKKDLKKVSAILLSLENGDGFDIASDTINDKVKLKEKITQARARVEEILQEINSIVKDEAYQVISSINDLDLYLDKIKYNLNEQYQILKVEFASLDEEKNIQKENNNISTNKKNEDNFWGSEF